MSVPRCLVLACVLALPAALMAQDADWPQHRYDPGRTAASPNALPDKLGLIWMRRLPPQVPAWKDEGSMQFDRAYQPIVLGKTLLVGSTVNDSLSAYDADNGEFKWRFFTEGPVRVAPAGWRDLVFVASDDGCLYAITAGDGKLKWKHRGGPSARRAVGNERIVSMWPARGGPVVADNTVYYAVGVWPLMGTFVYALDAASGNVLWFNDQTSFLFRKLPHEGSYGFSGLSPQGHLAVAGDRLVVPGARSNPAIFDRRSGAFIALAEGNGPSVTARGDFGIVGGQLFSLKAGLAVHIDNSRRFTSPVLSPDVWFTDEGSIDANFVDLKETNILPAFLRPRTTSASEDDEGPVTAGKPFFVATANRLGARVGTPLLRAGNKLLVNGKGGVQVYDASAKGDLKLLADVPLANSPASALVANGKLYVISLDGIIACYGSGAPAAQNYNSPNRADPAPTAWADQAQRIIAAAKTPEGYALVAGLKDGGLVEELIRTTRLHVVALDSDAARVDSLRGKLDSVGLYGVRASAFVGDLAGVPFAPYLFSLTTSEDAEAAGLLKSPALGDAFAALRPYGGAIVLPTSDAHHALLTQSHLSSPLPGAAISRAGPLSVLARNGALPGSADWCGQNADSGNTRCSQDQLVMAPLGVLWWGNSLSNALILPRHGEGPVQQVAGGRLIIEGADSLSAADVYTGRLLWTRQFKGLGTYYDSTKHQRGAHALGSNFYVVPDAVYVAAGDKCHVLDPATGATVRELSLPGGKAWMFLLVDGDLLIAGSDPVVEASKSGRFNVDAYSKGLAVFDRRSGKLLWSRNAASRLGHYGIVAGGRKVFIADKPEILALDARSGDVLWRTDRCYADRLSYSAKHDVLLASGALRGKDGSTLWEQVLRTGNPPATTNSALSPDIIPTSAGFLWWGKFGPMLCGDTIITQGTRAIDLLTGKQKTRVMPDGTTRDWGFRKAHGCGPMAGAMNLMTFRSGDAGFYDLKNDGGTGNFGGFRAGCTANLIVADGVLNAPDYSRTCVCGYSNRSSLALVHMPEAEYWTYAAGFTPGRLGFNFGAPGDRVADGTLWRETPNALDKNYGGDDLVATDPPAPSRFYVHSSRISGDAGHKWVAGSGLLGLKSARIPLAGVDRSQDLLVRLYFAEPTATQAGARVFSIAIDGNEAIKDLDIFKESGGQLRVLVKELRSIRAPNAVLTLTFTATAGQPLICGVEILQADKIALGK
jgi:outer membrane protein assembly factor BamB